MIWTDSSVSFTFDKAALTSLPTAHFVALRPLVKVFLLKPASFCKLSAGFDTPASLSLLFFSFQALVLCSTHCPLFGFSFSLNLSGTSGKNCFLSSTVLSSYNELSDTLFFRGTMQLMSWPGGVRHSCLLQSSSILSDRVVLSHLISSTHRSPRCQLRNLCFLVTLVVSPLVFAATDTAFSYTLVSLELVESRNLHAAPAVIKPRTPLMSFCAVQLWTFCAALFLAIVYLNSCHLSLT